MRYLLDTNILVFLLQDKSKININIKNIISDYANLLYISSVSVMELIHLMQNKRIEINRDIFELLELFNLEVKYVTKEHLKTHSLLAIVPNHNDPNDRIIISQALSENIPLISSDHKIQAYSEYGLDFIFNKI